MKKPTIFVALIVASLFFGVGAASATTPCKDKPAPTITTSTIAANHPSTTIKKPCASTTTTPNVVTTVKPVVTTSTSSVHPAVTTSTISSPTVKPADDTYRPVTTTTQAPQIGTAITIQRATSQTQTPALAETGSETVLIALIGIGLVALGAGTLTAARKFTKPN